MDNEFIETAADVTHKALTIPRTDQNRAKRLRKSRGQKRNFCPWQITQTKVCTELHKNLLSIRKAKKVVRQQKTMRQRLEENGILISDQEKPDV